MTRREKNLMEVIVTIEKLGYTSCDYNVIMTEFFAHDLYGSDDETQVLPPHIGVWIKPEDRNIWANTGLWDDTVITGEGDTMAIYYFSDK